MAETLVSTITTGVSATLANPVTDGTANFVMDQSGFLAASLANGTAADQANQLYDEVTTLAASGSLTLSLYNFGAAADQLGQTRAITKLKYLGLKILGNLNCYRVTGYAVNAAGSGYVPGDTIVAAGGTGTAAKWTVATVGGGGSIATLTPLAFSGYTGGSYTAAPSATANAVTTSGSGTGATLNLTIGQYLTTGGTTPIWTDSDIITFGGDGATSALTSLFGTNADKLFIPSGTSNLPGSISLTSGAGGWTIGASTTNKNIKVVNGAGNPVTFRLIVIGAT
jgi:hypothetical protein